MQERCKNGAWRYNRSSARGIAERPKKEVMNAVLTTWDHWITRHRQKGKGEINTNCETSWPCRGVGQVRVVCPALLTSCTRCSLCLFLPSPLATGHSGLSPNPLRVRSGRYRLAQIWKNKILLMRRFILLYLGNDLAAIALHRLVV